MNYLQHPLSSAFPAMSVIEYDALCTSVADIGLQNPIVLYQGMVIDGWHRYRACNDEMMPCHSIELMSDIDPQSFVIAQNKERRHLTQSQLATAAIKVYEWLKDGVKQGLQASSAPSAEVKSSKQIAEIAGVSTKTVDEAKKVEKQATEEIKAKVASGEMSVSTAVKNMAKANASEPKVEDYAPSFNEIAEAEAEHLAKEQLFDELLNADDLQAELAKLAIKDKAMNKVLESRVNGLMNTVAAYAKIIKSRDSEIARLKKQLGSK